MVSSSPYTATVSNIEQCVRNGAGAVVLKSIFEEQIIRHAAALDYASQQGMGRFGRALNAISAMPFYKGEFSNCRRCAHDGRARHRQHQLHRSAEAWTDFAVSMEQAGRRR